MQQRCVSEKKQIEKYTNNRNKALGEVQKEYTKENIKKS